MLEEEQFQALKADIHENGQQEPVRVWMSGAPVLLDGRNRMRACEELRIDCVQKPFYGSDSDAIDLIVSLNLHRRHLTASQRAAIAVALVGMYEGAARSAQVEAGRVRAAAPRKANGQLPPQPEEAGHAPTAPPARLAREATAKAAAVVGVSRTLVAAAKTLSPAALDDVKAGNATVSGAAKAQREASAPPRESERPFRCCPMCKGTGKVDEATA